MSLWIDKLHRGALIISMTCSKQTKDKRAFHNFSPEQLLCGCVYCGSVKERNAEEIVSNKSQTCIKNGSNKVEKLYRLNEYRSDLLTFCSNANKPTEGPDNIQLPDQYLSTA